MSIRDTFLAHHIELTPEEEGIFERFIQLFMQYNAHTNLSAIRDEAGIIEKHCIDSLYGAPIITEFLSVAIPEGKKPSSPKKLLDIGSGGGFPGIPLKIVFPDLHVTLLDSVGKKVRATEHFVRELGLDGIRSIQDRAEHLAQDPSHRAQYDIIVSRATAYITDILPWAQPFLAPGGKILLYKMPSDEEKKDRDKIARKLGLVQEGELFYTLGGKERVILVFS